MDKSKYGVHQSHCCFKHGCKYGNEDCPVESGEIKQDYPCEDCSEEESCGNCIHSEECEQYVWIDKRKHSITSCSVFSRD